MVRVARLTVLPTAMNVNIQFYVPRVSAFGLPTRDGLLSSSLAKRQKNNSHRSSCFCDYYGPSGETRTHGLLNPIQARYHLRYTRMLEYCTTKYSFVNTFFEFFSYILKKQKQHISFASALNIMQFSVTSVLVKKELITGISLIFRITYRQ